MLHYFLEALFNAALLTLPFILVGLWLSARHAADALSAKLKRRRRIRAILHNEAIRFYN